MVVQTRKPNPTPVRPGRTKPESEGNFRTLSNTSEHFPTNSYTLEDLVDRFLDACRRQRSRRTGRPFSPRTLEYYQTCLSGLCYYAENAGWPAAAEEVTREHLRQYLYYLDQERYRWTGDGRRGTSKQASAATVHHYLKVAKTFFRWAVDEEYLPESPASASLLRMRLPSPQYQDVEPYTDEEVGAMLGECEREYSRGNRYLGARNKAMVSVFIDTGLRLSELSDMALADLDPKLGQVRVLGKGSKMRVVPLNGEARKALRLYLNQYRPDSPADAVWLTEDGAPLSSYSVGSMVERLKQRAGVTSGGGAHRFRHYFATRYLEAGGDMNNLRLLLGHATLYMVLRYTKFVQAQRAIESHGEFSPLDRLSRGSVNARQHEESWGYRR
jgi:site-specific recombinase XerD